MCCHAVVLVLFYTNVCYIKATTLLFSLS